MPSVDIEAIKDANPLAQVIAETEQLTGSGRFLRTQAHDSLVIDTHRNYYSWNSKGEQGDIFDWLLRYRGCTDFKDAVEWACRRSGLPAPDWGGKDSHQHLTTRAREDAFTLAARAFVYRLRDSEAARAYALSRWEAEWIKQSGVGFTGSWQEREGIKTDFELNGIDPESPAAVAVIGFQGDVAGWAKAHSVQARQEWQVAGKVPGLPANSIVYPHVRGGRVRYLSTRALEQKGHYNLPVELSGPRQPYFNYEYDPRSDFVVEVEGQADAITLAGLGYPGVAMAGTHADDGLKRQLAGHKRHYIGLDADKAGQEPGMKLAEFLGPLAHLVTWPAKDVNEWWKRDHPKPADVEALFEESVTYVEQVCHDVAQRRNGTKLEALRGAFELIARMDKFERQVQRKKLCKLLALDYREFEAMLKAAGASDAEGEDDETPKIRIETVGGHIGEHLIELLYNPERNETRFAVRTPGGEIKEVTMIQVEGVEYVPIWPTSMLATGTVLLPSRIGEIITVRDLQRQVRRYIHKWLDVDIFYEKLASYYVLFSWMYDSFNTVPYLRALGDYGTGKSTFLEVIGSVCYRPIIASGATTVSPIFRLLAKYHGTLILDEADFNASNATVEIIKLLNVGFKRIGGNVLRAGTEKNDFDPEAFDVYGPKVIASRREWKDKATESRCITKKMGGPTIRRDIPLQRGTEFFAEAQELRNLLLAYRLKNWKPAIELDETLIDRSVEPRLNQVVIGLLTLIDDPELRADIQTFIRDYNRQSIVDRSMTVAAKVVEALVQIKDGEPKGLNQDGQEYWDLSLKAVTALVKQKLSKESEEDELEEENEKGRKRITNKYIGWIVRNELQLQTERMSWDRDRKFGVVWDDERVMALRLRYGVGVESEAPAVATV